MLFSLLVWYVETSRNVGERRGRVAVRIYWVEERGRNFVCYRRKKNKIFG